MPSRLRTGLPASRHSPWACPAPDEALQNEMDAVAESTLTRSGYVRYEISNYARPGFASRHNRLHWTGGYLGGLGPSAQSYVGNRRFGNVSNLTAYNSLLRNGQLPGVGSRRTESRP